MNYPHLHLLTNHIPVLGSMFGLALLAWGLIRRDASLVKTALGGLVLVGLATIAIYFTGEPAEHAIRNLPDFSREYAHDHEEAAELATIAFGLFALLGAAILWRARGRPMRTREGVLSLIGAIIVSVMMGNAAFIGGRIRHTEIRPGTTTITTPNTP
jgi:hypothetical protein